MQIAKSRTQKAALNISTSAILEVVSLVCGLILPRLILLYFGSAYNGITSSASQFLNLISILNLGVAGSTRAALYRSLADHDNQKTSAIVRATERYMRKVGLVLAAYIIILAMVYPSVVSTGYSFSDVSLLILAVGISSFGNYFFGAAYAAFLSADQSIYISNIFTIIAQILNTIVSVILIKTGFTIQVVKLVSATVFFLKPLLQNLYVTKVYHLDKTCAPDDSALKKRTDVLAHSIANIVHDNTDLIVLTVFCGVKIVSVYTVYNLIMNALKKTQTVFTNGTEAIFGNMWAKGENEKIKRNLGIYEFFIMFMISVLFATAAAMVLPFVSLYTKGVHDVEYVLPTYSIIVVLAQMFYCYRSPYVSLVQGAGKYKETRNGAIIEAIINLFFSIILVQFLGIVGVAIGTLIANIFRTIQYAVYIENNLIHRGKLVFAKKIMIGLFCSVVEYLIASKFVGAYASQSWFMWAVCAICVFIGSVVISTLISVLFLRSDLKGFWEILCNLIKGKKKTYKTM